MANKEDLVLYYFPFSYYSRRALLALYEKKIPFRGEKIFITKGTQDEEWYLRLNPKGEVPVLKHGEGVVCDSTEIIKYLDEHIPTGHGLVPPQETEIGKEVRDLVEVFNKIVIDVITYGVWTNPDLSPGGLTFAARWFATPAATRRRLTLQAEKLKGWSQKPETSEEKKKYYLSKSQHWYTFLDNIQDKHCVTAHMDELEDVFVRAEKSLMKSRTGATSADSETWLCGSQYTIADVYLTILIERLDQMGASCRYFNINKNPNVLRFSKQAFARPAYKQMMSATRWYLWSVIVTQIIKKGFPIASGLALAGAAVGIFMAWRNR